MILSPSRVNSPDKAFVYITDCTLATVAQMAMLKSRKKTEFERQINIAQKAINWIIEFKIDPHDTRVREVIKDYDCDVNKWVGKYIVETSKSGKKTIFETGQKVAWESQASGHYKNRSGRVVYILSPGDNPLQVAKDQFPGHRRMFDGVRIPGRSNVGYLVEVITKPGTKPRLYMPYPSKLLHQKDSL